MFTFSCPNQPKKKEKTTFQFPLLKKKSFIPLFWDTRDSTYQKKSKCEKQLRIRGKKNSLWSHNTIILIDEFICGCRRRLKMIKMRILTLTVIIPYIPTTIIYSQCCIYTPTHYKNMSQQLPNLFHVCEYTCQRNCRLQQKSYKCQTFLVLFLFRGQFPNQNQLKLQFGLCRVGRSPKSPEDATCNILPEASHT